MADRMKARPGADGDPPAAAVGVGLDRGGPGGVFADEREHRNLALLEFMADARPVVGVGEERADLRVGLRPVHRASIRR